MDRLVSLMMSLIKREVCGLSDNIGISAPLSEQDAVSLYKLSKAHDLSHIVGSALEREGAVIQKDVSALFQKQAFGAIYRFEKINYEIEQIRRALEEGKIAFVLLKGAVIRKYYAEPWQRTSCDIDVLIHEEDLERATALLSDKLNYKAEDRKQYHDISLYSPSGVHIELHFSIKENMDNIDPLLERVWDHCYLLDGKCFEYSQTNEYLMFHLIAHTSYHYIRGGCGIKPFVDLYLLRSKLEYDESVLQGLCQSCNLDKFYRGINELVDVWFENKEHTALTLSMQDYIFNGGVYGTREQSVAVRQKKDGSKIKYIYHRIFMPYEMLKLKYPILKKHKYLTPVFQVRRWIEMMLKGNLKSSVREYKTVRNMTSERSDRITNSLEELGLI